MKPRKRKEAVSLGKRSKKREELYFGYKAFYKRSGCSSPPQKTQITEDEGTTPVVGVERTFTAWVKKATDVGKARRNRGKKKERRRSPGRGGCSVKKRR